MRIADWAFAGIFALSVAVQVNDPDPLPWMAAYGVALGLAIASALGRLTTAPLYVATGAYGVSIALLSPDFAHTSLEAFQSVGMNSVEDERVRELWGLVICGGWCLWRCARMRRRAATS